MKTVITSKEAPAAIGPYSQAIAVPASARLVFLSGQIPLDPVTGQLVEGDVQVQTERVLQNLDAVLKEAGAGFQHVVRATIFLIDLGDFAKVNELYARRFPSEPPARVTVQVSALPRGSKVEIDVIAAVP